MHELAHVTQYDRLGGILPFLRKYLFECLTMGYESAPLELEAIAVAARKGVRVRVVLHARDGRWR